jgi:hypothetical protein
MPCTGGNYDGDHEGHSGFEAIGIANYKLLPGWIDQVKPVDIVLMLLGTNDVVCNKLRLMILTNGNIVALEESIGRCCCMDHAVRANACKQPQNQALG